MTMRFNRLATRSTLLGSLWNALARSAPEMPSFSVKGLALSFAVGILCAAALWNFSLAYVPREDRCLPELHLALLVHHRPAQVERGNYLFWKASAIPALSYVRESYVLKVVAGVPGDRLAIKGDKVFINDTLVVEGLENAPLYKRRPADFERSEVIPPGRYFVIGTARFSNDSRYWGYLPHDRVVGRGYRVY